MSDSTFHRENRYIVIKRKDLAKVPVAYRSSLVDSMFSLQSHLPHRECLVIESDWPEYEPAWQMIERRVSGATGGQPEVVAVINEEGEHFKETVVEHRPGIDRLPVGTELVDRAHVIRLQAERDALQHHLNVADQRINDLTETKSDRSPQDYAIEHAEYMAKSADHVIAEFQAYGLALIAVDEGGDDGEGELFDAIDSARQDLQEALVDLRNMVFEFRKRRDRTTPQ